jgi:hypothetical protein
MVKDPKDYRWCGYGEAEAIGGKMVSGLRNVIAESEKLDDAKVLAEYRIKLFGKGSTQKRGDASSARINESDLQKVVDAGGKLTSAERLRLKMRWFSRGAVIGGHQFVDEHLRQYQNRTEKRRNSKPRPFVSAETENQNSDRGHTRANASEWTDMFSMRGGREV